MAVYLNGSLDRCILICLAMNKILGLLLFNGLLFFSKAYTQDYWFKTYDFGYTYGQEPWSIEERDGHIYILRFCNNKLINITQNGITKLDSYGNLIWSTNAYYPKEANANEIGYYVADMKIAKDNSVYFLSSATYFGGVELLLNKFDDSGNILWHKTYGKDFGGIVIGELGMCLDTDSLGVYLAARSSNVKKMGFYHVDSSGVVLWNKLTTVPVMGEVGYMLPIIRMPDKGIVVGYDNHYIIDRIDYLMRTDSMGNPQKFYTSPFGEVPRGLSLHPNGNLVYLSEENTPPMFEHGGMRLQMFTPELDTVWSYLYNDFTSPCIAIQGAFVRNLSIHPDGRILTSVSGSPNCLNLVCFSPEGSLLWEKELYVDKPELYSYGQELYGAIWTSDGGILVRGYLNLDVPGLGFRQKIFLMKLDSVGCLEPGCVSTIITPTEEPQNPAQVALFCLYPNPAGNVLNVETQNLDNGEFLLWLRDSYGRTIAEYTIGHTSQVDISHLAPGIYCATLIGDDGKSQTIRFVKMGD